MIFCRGETYYSYIEKATDEKGMEYSIFPIRPLSDSVGCESPGFAVLVDNFPVTLDRHSLYRWRSSSVRDERYAENIGERVRALLSGWDAALVRSFDSEKSSELFIRYGEHVLVYNYALDVFYLWRGLDACGFVSLDNGRILFLRADGALCALFESDTDDGEAVKAYWCTPYLELARGIKNLYSLSVTVSPDIDTAADIHWFSDHGESGSRSYSEEYRRFSFEKLNFARLGFMTGVCSRAFKLRLRHKRFEKLKLRFEDPYYSSTLHVLSFTASGLVTDKK
jgi:hypothetical protein